MNRGTALAAGVATVFVMPMFLVGATAVDIRVELGLTETQLGAAVAVFLGANLVAGPLGRAADRVGSGVAMRVAVLGSAASLFGIALSVHDVGTLLAWEAVAGLASALGSPATNLLVARTAAPSRQGLAFGIKQSAPPLAALLGGLSVPVLVLTVGWRWAFAAAGLFSLVLAAVIRVVLAGLDHTVPSPSHDGHRVDYLALGLLGAGMALGFAASSSLGTFFVTSTVEAGIDVGAAGILLTLGSAAAIAVRLAAGRLVDARPGSASRIAVGLALVGAIGYLVLTAHTPFAAVVGGALAFGGGWGWSGVLLFSVVRLNPRSEGLASGAVIVTGGSLGGIAGPLVFGLLAEGGSYETAWGLGALWCALAAAFLSMGWRRSVRSATTRHS